MSMFLVDSDSVTFFPRARPAARAAGTEAKLERFTTQSAHGSKFPLIVPYIGKLLEDEDARIIVFSQYNPVRGVLLVIAASSSFFETTSGPKLGI